MQIYMMKFSVKLLLLGSLGAALTAFQWCEMFEPGSLLGARVLVTGASTGIGQQMAYHYSRLGAKLVLTARGETLQQVAKQCDALGAEKVVSVAADMAQTSEPERVVRVAVEMLGGLDYLVLNHIGSSPYGPWDGNVEHIKWLLQVNFFSYVQMAKEALPALERSRGSVVVVSSLLGKICTPFAASYSASKFALNGFFGTLQHELAMQGSNVSISICTLGLINTTSALDKIKGYTSLPAYPASQAAWHILRAGALREPEAFYPWYTFYSTLLRDAFPSLRDWVIRNSFNLQPRP